jgi:anti-sigma regulatory factor (Ser/Thr protein kinase)
MTNEPPAQPRFQRLAARPAEADAHRPPADPTADLDLRFDAGPAAAPGARGALSALEGKLDPHVLEDLRLLVTELVTNSIRHAETAAIRLRVAIAQGVVHVEVTDTGRGFVPAPQAPIEDRTGGWGLYLVDRLADRWGVARDGLTRVWFEIDARARAAGGGAGMTFALSL